MKGFYIKISKPQDICTVVMVQRESVVKIPCRGIRLQLLAKKHQTMHID